jgi:AAA+ superfamily predicted ATPase
MNNKSRIFFAAHKAVLQPQTPVEKTESTDLGQTLLDIAHLYLARVVNADESDYWMTFVFDTCCSAGLCSLRYIEHLDRSQKRDYIMATLRDKRKNSGDEHPSNEEIIQRICSLVRPNGRKASGNEAEERKIASAILDYIHVLISIDRNITDKEASFFKTIRDGVYQDIGWQAEYRDPIKGEDDACSGHRNQPMSEQDRNKSVEELIDEIDSLIGLENIKIEVKSLVNSLQVQQMRRAQGLPNPEISNHMIFFGNPGTGKTTIARQLGHLYRQLGILSRGHFIETDRSGLVGGYLGQTALKTTEVLNSALGGILFIDEAYTLSSTHGEDQYGQEAIDTILKYMEDHRDDLIVIAAGYENLMGEFLQSNPGMKSRFNKYFLFSDYSEDELAEIFLSIASDSSYFLDERAEEHLRGITKEIVENKPENFGNGRTMRNLFERSLANQANRIVALSISEKADLQRIAAEDIQWHDLLAITH